MRGCSASAKQAGAAVLIGLAVIISLRIGAGDVQSTVYTVVICVVASQKALSPNAAPPLQGPRPPPQAGASSN